MKVHAPVIAPPLATTAAPPPAAKEATQLAAFGRSLGATPRSGLSTEAGDKSRTGRGDTAPRRLATPRPASPAASAAAAPAALSGDGTARALDAPYAPGSIINISA